MCYASISLSEFYVPGKCVKNIVAHVTLVTLSYFLFEKHVKGINQQKLIVNQETTVNQALC